MSYVPTELKYTKEHEWVVVEDRVATIGITDHAQGELGDITFIELPEEESEFSAGDELANIESVKAASPVFAPIGGTVVEVNGELDEEPGAINSDPYGAGWICRVEIKTMADLDDLMTAEEYEAFLDENEG